MTTPADKRKTFKNALWECHWVMDRRARMREFTPYTIYGTSWANNYLCNTKNLITLWDFPLGLAFY
jgi:hypothetical protein